jgi:hypothetical protein
MAALIELMVSSWPSKGGEGRGATKLPMPRRLSIQPSLIRTRTASRSVELVVELRPRRHVAALERVAQGVGQRLGEVAAAVHAAIADALPRLEKK